MVEHTADMGIRVCAPCEEALFHDAVEALLQTLGAHTDRESVQLELDVTGVDLADTLVRLLQEILFQVEVRCFRVRDFVLRELDEHRVRLDLAGETSDAPLATEIKAVTYHGLEIQKTSDGYETTIICDT